MTVDSTDSKILDALAAGARISLKALAAHVGLSSPSTSERIKRLEEGGVIKAYTVELDPEALGYPLQVLVRIRPLPGESARVGALIAALPEVSECDKVTGDDCFVARLHVKSFPQLDLILSGVTEFAETSTAVVKSKMVARRPPPLA